MLVLTQEESTSHTNMHYISEKNHIVTPFKTGILLLYSYHITARTTLMNRSKSQHLKINLLEMEFRSAFKCEKSFKGTVRPDWISMRVVSLKSSLKGHQPLYVFNFLFFILNF
jgi:hypothetical protein